MKHVEVMFSQFGLSWSSKAHMFGARSLWKIPTKCTRRTQNFVKKKLKAFPSRLNVLNTKQGLYYCREKGWTRPLRNTLGSVRIAPQPNTTTREMFRKHQKH